METGSSTPTPTSSSDPARKYGSQDPNNRNNFTCTFCGKVVKGGVFRLKQHLVGGFRNVIDCPNCPAHVQEEIKTFMIQKEMAKAELNMMSSRMHRMEDYGDDDEEEECVELTSGFRSGGGGSGSGSGLKVPPEKPKRKGPMDMYFTPTPEEAIKGRKDGKGGRQQTINEVCRKELRDRACREIARWFYDAGIPFNAATYDSFNIMIEAIGQFGPGMKPPSMYELRVPLLNKEVDDVHKKVDEHRKEWAEKGCSILSDGWRDSVVQKDIINFMVNSPKGSVFVKSMDVSDVSKDADMLFGVLDAMVEEVGEENVVQVVTDNASAYVKAGKLTRYSLGLCFNITYAI